MDLLPMSIIYWLFKPEVLDWPEINGKPSMKLEHLGAVNRLLEVVGCARLPFAAADRYEYWLLDRTYARPLALMHSCVSV